MRALVLCMLAVAAAQAQPAGEWRLNPFGDPFVRATRGLLECPVPLGPVYDAAGMRQEAHQRAERGTTCWLEKQCEEPNAYRYDIGIAERAVQAIQSNPRFERSSVWVTVQRRFVYLEGCAADQDQATAMEHAVQGVPEVDRVLPMLMVGPGGSPPYRTVDPGGPR